MTYVSSYVIIIITIIINVTIQFYMFTVSTCSNRTDDRLPDTMWCREPFMEALNEIEDIN